MDIEFKMLLEFQKKAGMLNFKPYITQYPYAYEKKYADIIRKYQKEFMDYAIGKFDQRLKKWFLIENYDEYSDDYELFNKEMNEKLLALFGASFLWNTSISVELQNFIDLLFKFDMTQWQRQLEHFLHAAYIAKTDWWNEIKNRWIQNNYLLVKNLSQDFLNKFNILLNVGIQNGWALDDFEKDLRKLYDTFSMGRVNLLARDQVGTVNSTIWKESYQSIGLDWYIWRTARDERVRGNPLGKYPHAVPSHYVMDNKLMKWSDSTVYSEDDGVTWNQKTMIMEPLHVGMAIACRCVPLPYFKFFAG